MKLQQIHILVVDDEGSARFFLSDLLEENGFRGQFTVASSGEEAWELLQDMPDAYHIILLDWMMPGISGMELFKMMKKDGRFSKTRVIFQTALIDTKHVEEGMAAGAFEYIGKPYDESRLLIAIHNAISQYELMTDFENQVGAKSDLSSIRFENGFRIQSLRQAELLAGFLSQFCSESMIAGMALFEVLANAIEHGNLGITYEQKTELLSGRNWSLWKEEVNRRLGLQENASKYVYVEYEFGQGEMRVTIKDQGDGFEPERFLNLDPSEVIHTHGRGVAMAKSHLSKVKYLGNGNEVLLVACLADKE